jgi:tetratricopeptide (TPR) repeat protein
MARRRKEQSAPRSAVVQTAEPGPAPQWLHYWWAIVLVVASAARLVLFAQFGHAPFANSLFLDSALYDKWAASILKGHAISDGRPFFIEPGYAYFLAGIKLLHGGTAMVRMLQSVIGIGTCLFTGLIAKRIGGERAALLAGLIAALYLPLMYFEQLVLKTTVEVFLTVVTVWFFLTLTDKPSPIGALIVGLLLGATFLVRGNVLILVPIFIAGFFLIAKKRQEMRPLVLSGLLLAGIAPVLIGVSVRNYQADREPGFMTSNSGINFYIGNSVTSNGTVPEFKFLRYDPDYEESDSQAEAARRAGRKLTASEASNVWWSQTWREIGDDPGHWLSLLGTKIMLVLNYYEFTDNESMYFVNKYVPMLKWPLPGFWLALPLGFAGIVYVTALRRTPAGLSLAAVIVLQLLGVVAFHFAERYRLGSVPFMIALGAPAILACFRDRRVMPPVLAVGAVGAVLVALPNPVVPNGQPLYNHYSMIGVASSGSGNADAAVAAFQEAIKDNPTNADSYYNLAMALFDKKHDAATAETNVRKALELDPNYGDAYSLLGRILMASQRFPEAGDSFMKASAAGYNPAESMISAGAAYGQGGQFDKGIELLQKGLAEKPDDATGLEMLGNCYYMQKNTDQAKQYWKKALAANPDNAKLRQTYQKAFNEAP